MLEDVLLYLNKKHLLHLKNIRSFKWASFFSISPLKTPKKTMPKCQDTILIESNENFIDIWSSYFHLIIADMWYLRYMWVYFKMLFNTHCDFKLLAGREQ